MSTVGTVVASVLTSTIISATLTGYFDRRNERDRQSLESRRALAGDFGGAVMHALAALRHFKPTTRVGHRNEDLHGDVDERRDRAEAVDTALDQVRILRGRIWVTFPGRSTRADKIAYGGPISAADHADEVMAYLRRTQEHCQNFWAAINAGAKPRTELEEEFDAKYDEAKESAWQYLDRFALSAVARMGEKPGDGAPDLRLEVRTLNETGSKSTDEHPQ